MTGLVRKASLLVVLGLLATTAALAGVPDPTMSVIPSYIDLVACSSGVEDPAGAFTVTVNDAAGNPIQGCTVKIVFASDLYIYDTITGLTVNCTDNAVEATSASDGVASFTISGATINTNGVATGSGTGGATIYACDVALGTATVCAFDENGAVSNLGIEVTDLTAWLRDFGSVGTIGYKGRSDFTHSGTLDVVDLTMWLKRFGTAYKTACGTLCP